MRIIGLIAEYNPFHNGHIYQIKKIKEMYPDSLIIAIISTNFTERGDISIINKWDKTEICLKYGIDIVIELPTLYATQSADMFAYGAINILNSLKIDTLVFGTESDDLDELVMMANVTLNNKKYDELVNKYMTTGINYPTAKSKAIYDITKKKIDQPNDLLALSYIKEIVKNSYSITPISIKRTSEYHGKNVSSNIISANLIRELLNKSEDISLYVPCITKKKIIKDMKLDNAYSYLLYNIVNNKDILNSYLTVDEGIENRILDGIHRVNDWHSLVMKIKTKRYTYNKINRMLLHILLNIHKVDNNNEIYLRILGFNSKGQNYLNKIKKEINIPVFTGYKPKQLNVLDIEFRSTFIYAIIVNDLSLIDKEYRGIPIIMK